MKVRQLPNEIPLAKIVIDNGIYVTNTWLRHFDTSLYRLEAITVRDEEGHNEKMKRDALLIAEIAAEYHAECVAIKRREYFKADAFTLSSVMQLLFTAFSALREIRYYQFQVTGKPDNSLEEIIADCSRTILLCLNTLDGNVVKDVSGYYDAVKLYSILESLCRQAVEEYETVKSVAV